MQLKIGISDEKNIPGYDPARKITIIRQVSNLLSNVILSTAKSVRRIRTAFCNISDHFFLGMFVSETIFVSHFFRREIEITSMKAPSHGIFTRVSDVSVIERVSATSE